MPGPIRGPGPGGAGGPHGGFQKPKNTKKTLRRLLSCLKNDIPLLVLVIIFVGISTTAQLFSTLKLQPIINLITGQEDGGLGKVAAELLQLVVLYLAAVVTTFFQNRIMIRISQNTVLKMRKQLFDRLMTLPLRFFDTNTHGQVMSRFSNDMDAVSETLNNSAVQVFSSSISLVGTLISMLWLSPILTLINLVLFPLMIGLARFILKRSRRQFSAQQRALGELNGYIEETIEGQKVVKVFCYEERAEQGFETVNEVYRKNATLAQLLSGVMMPLMQHISTFSYVFTAAIGAVLALNGSLTLGGIAVFLNLSRQFGRPVTEISNQLNMIQSALAGAERVFEIMDTEPESADDPDAAVLVQEGDAVCWRKDGALEPVRGEVRMEQVTFGYVPEKVVLRKVSLTAAPGQKIALVGSTGAGKTTITNLLTRFYDIQEGSIRFDGIDIRRIRREDLRRCLAMVLQDTHLFTGTVMENIRYGRLDATDEDCIAAAKLASAHSFIVHLPEGYNTVLEGDGSNLSQGQRQLLNIARAAVADPPILILDEATSSVDTRTELHIEQGMDRLMEGRTTFVIAHRLSTVRNADTILVIEHGEILERGNHDELMALQGRYYQLYTGQFQLD